MSGYALIKDGVVVNAVVWNGEGDLFSEYETYEIKDGGIRKVGNNIIIKLSD